MKLEQTTKTKWLEALRSGQYAQGTRYLHHVGFNGAPDRFCCLGVLCEIKGVETSPENYEEEYTDNSGNPQLTVVEEYEFEDNSSMAMPTDTWFAELLTDYDAFDSAEVAASEAMNRLASMNDKGKSFAEIADYIETNL